MRIFDYPYKNGIKMRTFDYPYKIGINIPAWVLQISVCCVLIALASWGLSLEESWGYNPEVPLAEAGSVPEISLSSITIVLCIAEIVLYGKSKLDPSLYLASTCIKTLIWTVMLLLSLISLAVVSISLTAVLSITSIMQLVYAAKIVHRKRRGTLGGGEYSPAGDYVSGLGPPPRGSYAAYNSLGSNPRVNAEYGSQPPAPAYSQPREIASDYASSPTRTGYDMEENLPRKVH